VLYTNKIVILKLNHFNVDDKLRVITLSEEY